MDALSLRPVIDPGMLRQTPRTHAPSAADAARVGGEFETMFLSQMLGHMVSNMPTNGPFGGGFGEEMFRSMQVDEWSKALVNRGGIGLAQSITREILRLQEQRS
jgi:Rod binding domain-containing protein